MVMKAFCDEAGCSKQAVYELGVGYHACSTHALDAIDRAIENNPDGQREATTVRVVRLVPVERW